MYFQFKYSVFILDKKQPIVDKYFLIVIFPYNNEPPLFNIFSACVQPFFIWHHTSYFLRFMMPKYLQLYNLLLRYINHFIANRTILKSANVNYFSQVLFIKFYITQLHLKSLLVVYFKIFFNNSFAMQTVWGVIVKYSSM